MARNPKQAVAEIHKTMDPRMIQQMGGAENVMKMMSEMGKLEAEGGLGKLMA